MDSKTIKIYTQPAFLICIGVLAVAGGGMSVAVKKFGVYLEKEPLPLKKSLDLMDEGGMGPYKIVAKDKIENEEIIKSLGTEDYIQWAIEDTSVPADSAVRRCILFITYYERPDRVPHVPEECYTGSGFQKVSSDGVMFEITGGGKSRQIPGRYLVFAQKDSGSAVSGGDMNFPVLYFFNVNGTYADSRESARIALNKNIFGKGSYFSKVEWKFFNIGFGSTRYPSKNESIEASQRFLSVILPILEARHWPSDNI